jgi:hypothetical protein
MDLYEHPPSESWESVEVPSAPGAAVWAWFRPPQAPCGIVFQIPPESHAEFPRAFTVRRLINALGIDCRATRMVFLSGGSFDAMQGMNPRLDKAIPSPTSEADGYVTVHLAPPEGVGAPAAPAVESRTPPPPLIAPVSAPVMYAQPQPAMPAYSYETEALYRAIESDWHAIQLLESKNLAMRKQMNMLLNKLSGLNRDLTPEERSGSDSLDHKDWNEARRWLRDGIGILSRIVKSHDIGVTSTAGVRNRFDDVIAFYVTPRRPHENLAAIQHQFEVHRKTVQSLHMEMQGAMQGAVKEGETRAQGVLGRIRAKLQAARGKR